MDIDPAFWQEHQRYLTRRWFFKQCGVGLAGAALAHLCGQPATAAAATAPAPASDPLAPKPPHFPARAKRVIYLFMAGAPSHLELFDHKPELSKWDGKLPPAELLKDYRAAFIRIRRCSAPNSSSPVTARVAPRFPSCCRTPPKLRTISAS